MDDNANGASMLTACTDDLDDIIGELHGLYLSDEMPEGLSIQLGPLVARLADVSMRLERLLMAADEPAEPTTEGE